MSPARSRRRHSGTMFDDAYAEELTKRYVSRPEWNRPVNYLIATSPGREPQRRWLNETLGALPSERDRYVTRLKADRNFLAAYNELAVAAVFLGCGYDVEPDPDLEGLTPDFLVQRGGDTPTIVEVYTRHRSDPHIREEQRWKELKVRARAIPLSVGLVARIPDGSGLSAPDSKTCIAIVDELKRQLLSLANPPGNTLFAEGYLFHVFEGLSGMRATMSTPPASGWHDADQVLDAIGEKVSRYADIVGKADMRLVVVVAAELESSLTGDLVRTALTGAQSLTLNLDPFGPSSTGPHTVRLRERDEPIRFHEAVSGVGWLVAGTDESGPLIVYRVASAERPLPWVTEGRLEVVNLFEA